MENTEMLIPAPVKNEWKSKLDNLEINGSFNFDIDQRSTVASAVTMHFHKNTKSVKRFTISADPENPAEKLRVWRISNDTINE